MQVYTYRQNLSSRETDPALIAISAQHPTTQRSSSSESRRGDDKTADERRKQALIESPGNREKRPIALYPLRHEMNEGARDQLFFAQPDDRSTPSGPGAMMTVCTFGHNHQALLEYAQKFLVENRDKIGLERPWSLNVVIVCPDMMPHLEGSLMYDETKWFAEITLRCDLWQDDRLATWVLSHECLELKDWRTGSVFQDLSQFMQQEYDGGEIGAHTFQMVEGHYLQKYLKARNQEIEQRVHEYLGMYRPAHLTNPSLPAVQSPRSSARTAPLSLSGDDTEGKG